MTGRLAGGAFWLQLLRASSRLMVDLCRSLALLFGLRFSLFHDYINLISFNLARVLIGHDGFDLPV